MNLECWMKSPRTIEEADTLLLVGVAPDTRGPQGIVVTKRGSIETYPVKYLVVNQKLVDRKQLEMRLKADAQTQELELQKEKAEVMQRDKALKAQAMQNKMSTMGEAVFDDDNN